MRIANIVLFHNAPQSVERLIKATQHPDFDFYLHLDKKVDIQPFLYLANLPNTEFIKNRVSVQWAGFSQVGALLASLEQIFRSNRSYDFINLLSGQDYPIKPVTEIYDVLANQLGKSFMITETPPTAWWNGAMSRINNYHFVDNTFVGKHMLGSILTKLLPKRRFPLPMKLYGGPYGAYWILSFEAAKYIYSILTSDKKIVRFFKYTWAPDEFLIHTLLMNSPFKETIVQENYHYLDTSLGGARPKTLTREDFPLFEKSGKLFARKFDAKVDAGVLDMIDEKLLSKDN